MQRLSHEKGNRHKGNRDWFRFPLLAFWTTSLTIYMCMLYRVYMANWDTSTRLLQLSIDFTKKKKRVYYDCKVQKIDFPYFFFDYYEAWLRINFWWFTLVIFTFFFSSNQFDSFRCANFSIATVSKATVNLFKNRIFFYLS